MSTTSAACEPAEGEPGYLAAYDGIVELWRVPHKVTQMGVKEAVTSGHSECGAHASGRTDQGGFDALPPWTASRSFSRSVLVRMDSELNHGCGDGLPRVAEIQAVLGSHWCQSDCRKWR